MDVFSCTYAYQYLYGSQIDRAAVTAQSIRAFAPLAEGWVFESQLQQTYIVKAGSVSSTAKRSAKRVSSVLGDEHYKH